MKIGIIGVGIIGGACKYGFEKLGHQVICHDIILKTSIEDYQKAGMEEYGAYYKSFGLGSPLQYWNQGKKK